MNESATLAQSDDDQRPLSDLDSLIGYNLKRAYMIAQADFRKALDEDQLGPRDFSALLLVAQFPEITQSRLARMLGIERSGLVAIVDALENRGLLKRTHVEGDRRVQALVATPKGQTAYVKALGLVRDHEEKLFSVLTDQERDTLVSLLHKIRALETD